MVPKKKTVFDECYSVGLIRITRMVLKELVRKDEQCGVLCHVLIPGDRIGLEKKRQHVQRKTSPHRPTNRPQPIGLYQNTMRLDIKSS